MFIHLKTLPRLKYEVATESEKILIPNGEKKGRIDSGNKCDYHDNHNNQIVPRIESSQILRRLSLDGP